MDRCRVEGQGEVMGGGDTGLGWVSYTRIMDRTAICHKFNGAGFHIISASSTQPNPFKLRGQGEQRKMGDFGVSVF
jgi:hypothetical protein